MIDHISIGVRDIAAAKKFYDAALQPLGYECLSQSDGSLGYGRGAVVYCTSGRGKRRARGKRYERKGARLASSAISQRPDRYAVLLRTHRGGRHSHCHHRRFTFRESVDGRTVHIRLQHHASLLSSERSAVRTDARQAPDSHACGLGVRRTARFPAGVDTHASPVGAFRSVYVSQQKACRFARPMVGHKGDLDAQQVTLRGRCDRRVRPEECVVASGLFIHGELILYHAAQCAAALRRKPNEQIVAATVGTFQSRTATAPRAAGAAGHLRSYTTGTRDCPRALLCNSTSGAIAIPG